MLALALNLGHFRFIHNEVAVRGRAPEIAKRKSKFQNLKWPDEPMSTSRSVSFKFRAGHKVSAAGAKHLATAGLEPGGADRAELVRKLDGGFVVGGLGRIIIHDGVPLRHSVPR